MFKHYLPSSNILIITKKYTQCKTLYILKIYVFELPDNKNIRILFSKNMKCFSKIKLISVLILLKYWYYSTPFLYLPYLPHHLCLILPCRNPSSTILIMLFFGFPILPYPVQSHFKSIGYTKANAKTSQSNLLSCYMQIIKSYVDEAQNNQKAGS